MGMFLKFVLSIVFAIWMSVCAFRVGGPITLIMLAIAVAPLIFTIRSRKARQGEKKEALLAAACDAIGVPIHSARFAHQEADTVLVLNPATRKMAVSVGGKSKVYGYDDVRSWDARKVSRSGGAVGFGGVGAISAGSQNIADSMRADRQTGLFLTMRDIDDPEWRVSMFESSDRARWAEILRQELSEGGAAA